MIGLPFLMATQALGAVKPKSFAAAVKDSYIFPPTTFTFFLLGAVLPLEFKEWLKKYKFI